MFALSAFLKNADQIPVIIKDTQDLFTGFVCPTQMNCLHQALSVFAHSFPLKARLMDYEAQDS